LRAARGIFRRPSATTDETNSTWQRELASAQVESARLQLALGETASADQLLQAAFAALAREDKAGREDRDLRLLEAQAHIVRGQVATRRNEGADAREHWTQARETIANEVHIGANPNFLATWASALLLLGEPEAARPAIDQLAAMGFYTLDFAAVLAATNAAHLVTAVEKRCGNGESVAPSAEKIH
jgi:hypothetical protein